MPVNGPSSERPAGSERQSERHARAYRLRFASALQRRRQEWFSLGSYQRFEYLVSLLITMLIGAVIVASLVHLAIHIGRLLVFNLVDPSQTSVFQTIFGMILTVLIAVEFNHSLVSVLESRQQVVQLRAVLLIALLAMVRKFIILDIHEVQPLTLIGLALSAIALGGVYWLVRDQDTREAQRLAAV